MRYLIRHVKCMRYLILHVKCMRILIRHVKCMGYFNSPCKMYHFILTTKKRHIEHLLADKEQHKNNTIQFTREWKRSVTWHQVTEINHASLSKEPCKN